MTGSEPGSHEEATMCRSDGSRPADCDRIRSHNYDANGRRVNPQGGHYMIPADQFAAVVARMQWDKRVLNCFEFVPLTSPTPRCPAAVPRPLVPARPVCVRRR
jgi:hypothetical protein